MNPNSIFFLKNITSWSKKILVTNMKNSYKSMIDPYQKAGKFLKLKNMYQNSGEKLYSESLPQG